jgi:cell division protease FtsH
VSKNNKKWRNVGLYAILAVVVVALATAFLDRPQNEQLTWKYSKFIEQVESKQVERVNLSGDRHRPRRKSLLSELTERSSINRYSGE